MQGTKTQVTSYNTSLVSALTLWKAELECELMSPFVWVAQTEVYTFIIAIARCNL